MFSDARCREFYAYMVLARRVNGVSDCWQVMCMSNCRAEPSKRTVTTDLSHVHSAASRGVDMPQFIHTVDNVVNHLTQEWWLWCSLQHTAIPMSGVRRPAEVLTVFYSRLACHYHDRQMPEHMGHLADKNFLIRMLFKDSYY